MSPKIFGFDLSWFVADAGRGKGLGAELFYSVASNELADAYAAELSLIR